MTMNIFTIDEKVSLEGMFKKFQPLEGHDWLRRIPAEDREVFSWIGRTFHNHGKMGGKARARTANRCKCGKFIANNQELCKKCKGEQL
jgi:hypothetical protein